MSKILKIIGLPVIFLFFIIVYFVFANSRTEIFFKDFDPDIENINISIFIDQIQLDSNYKIIHNPYDALIYFFSDKKITKVTFLNSNTVLEKDGYVDRHKSTYAKVYIDKSYNNVMLYSYIHDYDDRIRRIYSEMEQTHSE